MKLLPEFARLHSLLLEREQAYICATDYYRRYVVAEDLRLSYRKEDNAEAYAQQQVSIDAHKRKRMEKMERMDRRVRSHLEATAPRFVDDEAEEALDGEEY